MVYFLSFIVFMAVLCALGCIMWLVRDEVPWPRRTRASIAADLVFYLIIIFWAAYLLIK